MPVTVKPEEYIDELVSVADEVERVGSSILDEILDSITPDIPRKTTPEVRETVKKGIDTNFRGVNLLLKLLLYGWRRRKASVEAIARIFSLPYEALASGAHVTLVLRKGDEQYTYKYQYTAFDLLEYMVLQTLARDPEARRVYKESVINSLAFRVIQTDKGIMTMKEYVEGVLGVKWEDLAVEIEREIDGALASYVSFIESVNRDQTGKISIHGDKLAAHIYWREKVLKKASEEGHPWAKLVLHTSAALTSALITLHAVATYRRATAPRRWVRSGSLGRETILKYYASALRFGAMVKHTEDLVLAKARALAAPKRTLVINILRKGVGAEKVDISYSKTREEAENAIKQLAKEGWRVAYTIAHDLLPDEVVVPFSPLDTIDVEKLAGRVSREKRREAGRSRREELLPS